MKLLADTGSILALAFTVGIVYIVIFWVAIAYTVVRDARQRSSSISFTLFAVILGFFPPFLGALIYLIVRPPTTLAEERERELEEEALMTPVDTVQTRPCPSCGRDIDDDFILCPYCRTQFARRCVSCQRSLRLGWNVCPYCGEDVGVQPLRRRSGISS